ncbi:MAG: sulfotransferase family 2 domain-containing protein, partial [Alteriqipengyuania sp.]
VVRNPYDRVLSSVLHFSRNDKQRLFDLPDRPGAGDFEAAILAWIEVDAPDHNVRAHRRPQSDYVRMKDRANATDFTLRFEHLNDDFDRLRDRLGATGVSLGRTGAGRLRDRDYRDLYTDTSRKAVERAFAADLELFAYCF